MSASPSLRPATPPPLTVAHIPSRHDYVSRLSDARIHVVDVDAATADQWRPSAAFAPGWVENDAARAGVDVVHLHFGFEHLTDTELASWAARLRAAGIALVVTVHDLANPHLADQEPHLRRLAALVTAADRVLTLTDSAAAEIEQRWSVRATVAPHPHMFPLDLVGRRRPQRHPDAAPRLGLVLGSLRPNVDGRGALTAALAAVRNGTKVTVRIDGQTASPEFPRPDPGLWGDLENAAARGDITLDVRHSRQGPGALWVWLSGLDALLLPYRWGTHSGWVESCHDVGTAVIAPSVGHWHRQRPVVSVPELRLPAAASSVAAALDDLPPKPGCPADTLSARRAELLEVRRIHLQTYADAMRSVRT